MGKDVSWVGCQFRDRPERIQVCGHCGSFVLPFYNTEKWKINFLLPTGRRGFVIDSRNLSAADSVKRIAKSSVSSTRFDLVCM